MALHLSHDVSGILFELPSFKQQINYMSTFKDTPAFSGFSVNDMQKAKEFYGQTLGIEISEIVAEALSDTQTAR